jgi:hypothetical protein
MKKTPVLAALSKWSCGPTFQKLSPPPPSRNAVMGDRCLLFVYTQLTSPRTVLGQRGLLTRPSRNHSFTVAASPGTTFQSDSTSRLPSLQKATAVNTPGCNQSPCYLTRSFTVVLTPSFISVFVLLSVPSFLSFSVLYEPYLAFSALRSRLMRGHHA